MSSENYKSKGYQVKFLCVFLFVGNVKTYFVLSFLGKLEQLFFNVIFLNETKQIFISLLKGINSWFPHNCFQVLLNEDHIDYNQGALNFYKFISSSSPKFGQAEYVNLVLLT